MTTEEEYESTMEVVLKKFNELDDGWYTVRDICDCLPGRSLQAVRKACYNLCKREELVLRKGYTEPPNYSEFRLIRENKISGGEVIEVSQLQQNY